MGKLGDMKRRVEITNPVTSKSNMGAPQKSFAHFCYLMTSRKVVADAPESYVNNRLVVAKRYKYRAHYFSAIDETMRLIDSEKTFNIISVLPDPEDDLFIEINVEEVTE